MIRYVKLEVLVHGLDAPTAQSVADRVRRALTLEFQSKMASDLEIDIVEASGTPSWGTSGDKEPAQPAQARVQDGVGGGGDQT